MISVFQKTFFQAYPLQTPHGYDIIRVENKGEAMTLHEVINLFTYRTLSQYEVVEMARFHKVIYPRGTIKTTRDIRDADKLRKVLIIDNFTIYLGPKIKKRP